MANLGNVSGLPTVLRNLRRAGDRIAAGVQRGLTKGGLYLQAKSMDIVPVQLGTLKATAFTRNVGGQGFNADIVVGYNTDYAVFVHEDLTKAHGQEFNIKHADEIAAAAGTPRGTAKGGMFPRPENQQAKFLERPMRQYRREIIGIVADEARRVR